MVGANKCAKKKKSMTVNLHKLLLILSPVSPREIRVYLRRNVKLAFAENIHSWWTNWYGTRSLMVSSYKTGQHICSLCCREQTAIPESSEIHKITPLLPPLSAWGQFPVTAQRAGVLAEHELRRQRMEFNDCHSQSWSPCWRNGPSMSPRLEAGFSV